MARLAMGDLLSMGLALLYQNLLGLRLSLDDDTVLHASYTHYDIVGCLPVAECEHHD